MLRVLRAALWITLVAGILAWGDAAWVEMHAPPPPGPGVPMPSLPGGPEFEILGMLVAGLFCLLPSTLGLVALRFRRPTLAALYFIAVIGLVVYTAGVMLGQSGIELWESGSGWAVVAIPGWWALLVVMATAKDALAQLGVSGRWRYGVLGTLTFHVGALMALLLISDWRSASATRALARLHRGQSWREVVLDTEDICPMGRGDLDKELLWLSCPSAVIDGQPLVLTSIALRFEGDKLVTWSRRPVLAVY